MRGSVVYAADLFCGAGGTSQGLARACERLGRPVDLVAVNHWPRAVATHELNHPWARHYCARIDALDPRLAVPGGLLDLIVAGVECTHHSRARGGKPMNDQSRASAWHVLHWAEQLHVREILVENVAEFVQWGPLDDEGKPIPERRGSIFRAFVAALEAMNYKVEWRLLTAADYGDPTTRRRFFLRARLNGESITWPEPTHAQKVGESGLSPWRSAREIIEWQDLGDSIFSRKKPLADRTLARIAEGVRRFCGEYAEPFLVMLYGTGGARSVDRPLPTVTARGEHIALAQPFLTMLYGNSSVRSLDLPSPTVTAGPGHIALATPFITKVTHGARPHAPRSLEDPLQTVTTKNGFALVSPFILPHDQFTAKNGLSLVDSIDRPLRTVTASAGADNYLVSPFIVPHFGEREGQAPRTHSLDEPLPTVTATKGAGSLVLPFLVPYYGTGGPRSVEVPLGTVTTHDRFALVSPDGYAADIYFRMLRPVELARAQGFPDAYLFSGTKTEVVRQIGNAVPVGLAEELCHSILVGEVAAA